MRRLRTRFRTSNATAFSPASLFASGEPGGWYDIDPAYMFQDSAGTSPVTATGQTVGLVLDRSKGLVLGPELVTNGTFDSNVTGWTANLAATVAWDAGRMAVTRGSSAADVGYQEFSTVSGRTYKLSYQATGSSSSCRVATSTAFLSPFATLPAGESYFVAQSATTYIGFGSAGNGLTAYYDNISVKELPGNHLSQPTLANRPIYGIEPFGGRRNLLTYTEQFDNAVWLKQAGTSVVANQAVAPDGTTTADLVTGSGTSGIHLASGVTGTAGIATTKSIYLRGVSGGETVYLKDAAATVGVTTCTLTTSWQRFTLSETVGVNSQLWVDDIPAGGIYIWGAQLETGSTATAYQRVTDQWNVTQAGVPSVGYLQYDGSDDWFVSPTITPGIDKAQVFAGVRKLSDAADVFVETSTNAFSNNGAFNIQASNGTGAYFVRSTGTAQVNATSSVFAAPETAVLTMQANIAADTLSLRRNGTQIASSTADQGTGNYLAYPLYIGRRGGTSLPYNGRIYSLIVRFGANLTADQIAQTESYVNSKTGAY